MKKIILLASLLAQVWALAALDSKSAVSGKNILTDETILTTVAEKKSLVVVFLSAHCPCSASHIEELKSLSHDYPDFNFVGVHSNVDEGVDLTKTYFAKVALPFAVIQDVNTTIADLYQAFKTPHAFVIQADGKIIYQGGVSSSKTFAQADHKFLREALENIHLGQTVAKPEGRTLGCTIARNLK
ncbi:MAG: redoxin domain-containing protein [Bdellovibrionaceae bacterium]|nr:redoxin domain-containing protein [Pseudobdellovibrionaceae bacterium]